MFVCSIFICTINAYSQNIMNATWLRHTCGYTNGTNLLGGDVWGDALCTDLFGNSYNSGSFAGYYFTMDTLIDMNTNRFYINKYDAAGNRIWTAKAKGTSINSIMTSSKMLCDSIGNVYICGTFSVEDSAYLAPYWYPIGGGYIAKYDSSGNNIWCKYISRKGTAGVSFNDMSLANGYIYACGIGNYGTIIFGTDTFITNYQQNGFVTKLDLNGNIIKSRLLDSNTVNELHGIVASKYSNHVYLVGEQLGQGATNINVDGHIVPLINNATNSILIKMNSNLVAQWAKGGQTYLNSTATWGSGTKSLSRVGIDKYDNIYAIANGNGDSTRFGTLGFNHVVNGGYVQDVYTIKFDANGVEQWLRYGRSAENDVIRDIAVDEYGNSIVSVFSGFNATGGFVFGSDTLPRYYGGLVKYDPLGNILFIKSLQEARSLKALAYGIDSTFYGTGTGFNPGLPYLNLSITQCEDTINGYYNPPYKMIMVKFFDNSSIFPNSIKNITSTKNEVTLFPIPAHEFIYIEHHTHFTNNRIEIYNMSGQLIIKKEFNRSDKIAIETLSGGMYYYKVFSNNNLNSMGKFIKN